MSPRVPAGVKASRQPVRSAVSVSMSSSGTVPHRPRIAALSRRRLRGSGTASRSVRMMGPAFGRSLMFTQSSSGRWSLRSARASAISAQAGMGSTRLFRWGVMDAGRVARAGHDGLRRGRTLVIPGLLNQALAFSVRLSPRILLTKVSGYLQA